MSLPRFIQPAVPLAGQCRFAVGGPADYFARVESAAGLQEARAFALARNLPCFVYSGGSNLFFDSQGFRGLVVRLHGGAWQVTERQLPAGLGPYRGLDSLATAPAQTGAAASSSGRSTAAVTGSAPGSAVDAGSQPVPGDSLPAWTACVTAAAGCDLPALVRGLAALGLGGIEWLGNIPGSLGGAVAGNAGCYGHAIAEVLVDAEVLEPGQPGAIRVGPDYFAFAYRHSSVKEREGVFVTDATLRLQRREPQAILQEVEDELNERRRKHPHDAKCAGSFFKNPSRERPAWKLLEEAGMRAARVGDALLHPKHLNFLVNAGQASSADILALARQARQAVLERCGVELEAEVRYIGVCGPQAI